MRTADSYLGVRVSTALLAQLDADAERLGMTRSALIRIRLQYTDDVADASVIRSAAEQLRAVLDLMDTGDLGGTPVSRHHLAGAADALHQAADS